MGMAELLSWLPAQLQPGWEPPAAAARGVTPLQAHKPGEELTSFPALAQHSS